MDIKLNDRIVKINLLEKEPHDPALVRAVSQLKRAAELWSLDADFRKTYESDPEKAIAGTGLDLDPEAVRLLFSKGAEQKLAEDIKAGKLSEADIPESFILYRASIREKLLKRDKLRQTLCVPDEPHFRAWRERQDRRCLMEMGPSARRMVHAPLMFELTLGCSVGCPFCGVASKGLCGIFRYTDENAALWRETLSRLHALFGDAAGRGTCYYSCEGLDNPDYEKFIADYFREFGVVPQTTTAASTRDLERTRALLRFGDENDPHVDRFSVISADMRDKLFAAFTPEELVNVELLPQFTEAPGNCFTKSGRNRGEEDEDTVGGTIACASGFIVNMQEKTVRLMTPFVSDRDHPTGEWVLEKCAFHSAGDLEKQIRRMIEVYMPLELSLEKKLKASCEFHMKEADGMVWVGAHGMKVSMLHAPISQAALDAMTEALRQGQHTGDEILGLLPEDTAPAEAIVLLKQLWNHGLIHQAAE